MSRGSSIYKAVSHGEVRQFRADGFRRLADTGTRGADPFQPNRPTKKKKNVNYQENR